VEYRIGSDRAHFLFADGQDTGDDNVEFIEAGELTNDQSFQVKIVYP
jgi:hypothetical protein